MRRSQARAISRERSPVALAGVFRREEGFFVPVLLLPTGLFLTFGLLGAIVWAAVFRARGQRAANCLLWAEAPMTWDMKQERVIGLSRGVGTALDIEGSNTEDV